MDFRDGPAFNLTRNRGRSNEYNDWTDRPSSYMEYLHDVADIADVSKEDLFFLSSLWAMISGQLVDRENPCPRCEGSEEKSSNNKKRHSLLKGFLLMIFVVVYIGALSLIVKQKKNSVTLGTLFTAIAFNFTVIKLFKYKT